MMDGWTKVFQIQWISEDRMTPEYKSIQARLKRGNHIESSIPRRVNQPITLALGFSASVLHSHRAIVYNLDHEYSKLLFVGPRLSRR